MITSGRATGRATGAFPQATYGDSQPDKIGYPFGSVLSEKATLPENAARKLQKLQMRRDNAAAVIQRLSQEIFEAMQALTPERVRFNEFKSRGWPEGHPNLAQQKARVDQAEAEVKLLQERADIERR